MLIIEGKVDNRHVVDMIYSPSYIDAVVVDNGEFKRVTYKTDDMRTWANDYKIDATNEEKEAYRKYRNDFQKHDKVKIISGRKMVGEIKIVETLFNIMINYKTIPYLGFSDGTKCQAIHCQII